jgi:uncharacterized protein (TIGR03437 family)
MTRLAIFSCLFFAVTAADAQTLSCAATAAPPLVAGEGIAERTGDIVLNCTGGSPGGTVSGNLTVFLSVNVTNHLSAANTVDVILTFNNGSGPQVVNVPATLSGSNTISFNGLNLTLSNTGSISLRLANIRAAASQLGLIPFNPINAFISLNGLNMVTFSNVQLTVGNIQRALYAGLSSKITCAQSGSPLPADTTTLAGFLAAGSVFNSTRLTEGFADAFYPRTAPQGLNADSGLRFIVRYSGFPSGARLFVPDVVAGSDTIQPTAGGDFGPPASGGKYAPGGNGSLLLARVRSTDASGAGGSVVYSPGAPSSGTVSFNSMGEVPLAGGSGFVVYEVLDANPGAQESVQFPTFLSVGPIVNGIAVNTNEDVSLTPVSTVMTASTTAPVPRFISVAPPGDCTLVGDCGANYFPRLSVNSNPIQYNAVAGSSYQVAYVQVQNQGGGSLRWTASVKYANGSGWLTLYSDSGTNNGTVRVDAAPGNLAPGTYNATLTIDAGPIAGSRDIPVTLVITAATPKVDPVVVSSVVNSATFAASPLAPGSIGTLLGTKLGGNKVTVTFDGMAGKVLYDSDTQINVIVPAELGARTSAQVIVSADGNSSSPQTIALAPFSPGIFQGGILNQDNSVNGTNQPAARGSVIQIFATGLSGNGVISAKIGDRIVSQPYYAGPAPGIAGVQQVDLMLPDDLTGTAANVSVCGSATAETICSPAIRIAVAQQ